jgi:very-short-patch-repair endonuclease
VTREAVDLARKLRRAPTPSEALAWTLLRGRRCHGLKFRRQQVIGPFVVDFYCAALRLALEIDGGVHEDPTASDYDRARDQVLAAHDIRVLRVAIADVTADHLAALLAPLVPAPSCPSLVEREGRAGRTCTARG